MGEFIAKEYLENKGFKILEQNCKNKYGEIDLICHLPAGRQGDKDSIVFVEVKTRIGELFGGPEGSLNKNKIRRLVRNAQAYMVRRAKHVKPGELSSYRIDAVCIVLGQDKKIKRIEHYKNITG